MLKPDWFHVGDLQVVVVANQATIEIDKSTADMISIADLVIALGNTDLLTLAAHLPPNKPAICLLGGKDQNEAPPAPFTALHGNGVTFKDWNIAGISGGRRDRNPSGFSVSDQEAEHLLSNLPRCDILLTHAPPVGAPWSEHSGIEAINEYIEKHGPMYHFSASNGMLSDAFTIDDTLCFGISGLHIPEPLPFE